MSIEVNILTVDTVPPLSLEVLSVALAALFAPVDAIAGTEVKT